MVLSDHYVTPLGGNKRQMYALVYAIVVVMHAHMYVCVQFYKQLVLLLGTYHMSSNKSLGVYFFPSILDPAFKQVGLLIETRRLF